MGLDLGPELLEVLDDGRLDSPGQRRVRVGNDPGLVSDGVEDILHTAFAEELVSGSEWDLNNGSELSELLGSVGFNVGDTLEVGWELASFRLYSRADLPMSILTICFQAVNRSRRISEGLSSWLLVFFWLRISIVKCVNRWIPGRRDYSH